MPQKRNPQLCTAIIGAAAQVRALVPLALEGMQTEHEGDVATGRMIDRALTDGCILTGEILQRLATLAAGLEVFPERMRRNLDLTGGMIMAEAVMLALGARLGRPRAHDVVHHATDHAVASGSPFRETLAEEDAVRSNLTAEQIEELLDPAGYIGLSGEFAEQGVARAREAAAALERGG